MRIPRLVLLLLMLVQLSCANHQETSPGSISSEEQDVLTGQVSQYIRRIFEDSRGNLWFGTNGEGVARYDGERLHYFLGDVAVRGISEATDGSIWFATSAGASVYQPDGEGDEEGSFRTYDIGEGVAAWCVLTDKRGQHWFGTEDGVYVCGKDEPATGASEIKFTRFPLPIPKRDSVPDGYPLPSLASCIYEDSRGYIWFGTGGSGVFILDPEGSDESPLQQITEQDGLCNNHVQDILEDSKGCFWFATRYGGICKLDPRNGNSFTHFKPKFPEEERFNPDFFWSICEDSSGMLWFGSIGAGLYRYDGISFTRYMEREGMANLYLQGLFEDKKGRLWVGSGNGVYRKEGERLVNVRQNGPW